MMSDWNPKKYQYSGRFLHWGENISPENRELMRKGEIFVLLDKNGKPYSEVLVDSYDQIRERKILAPLREILL
jgi:hypothetical protein